MSLELENRVAKLERDARVTRELLDATIVEIKAVHARLVAIETRMNAPPVTIDVRPGGFITRRDVYGDAKPSLAPPAVAGPTWEETVRDAARVIADEIQGRPIACNIDHDACSAEQRSGTGRAAQGPCVRGVVDLVAASADDQHAAERGTPAAGAEVTASEGGDTARADSVVAENAKAETMRKALANALGGLGSLTFLDGLKRVREMGVERDAMRHELAEMRAELERERVRCMAAEDALSKSISGERRKWATAIASAIVGADLSGCESFVSREEMAASVAAMRAELERERKLRRESEEAFKAASDPRSGVAQKRGLVTGARVRSLDHAGRVIVCGKIVGWDEDGDPVVEHTIAEHAYTTAYYADLVELDTEATT